MQHKSLSAYWQPERGYLTVILGEADGEGRATDFLLEKVLKGVKKKTEFPQLSRRE
jgi:hypothetical protein